MKIRFYHFWILRLFYWFWKPILVQRPDITREMHNYMGEWLESEANRDNKPNLD